MGGRTGTGGGGGGGGGGRSEESRAYLGIRSVCQHNDGTLIKVCCEGGAQGHTVRDTPLGAATPPTLAWTR